MKNQEQIENHRFDSNKRKWYYSDPNSYANYQEEHGDKNIAKKCMTVYDYENYQPNHQLSPNGQHFPLVNDISKQTQELNSMELSENIEYVNILYDDSLLTGIQAPTVTESNYINFEPNWNNADILDLDQRNYYYETTDEHTVVDLSEHDLQQQQQNLSLLEQPRQEHLTGMTTPVQPMQSQNIYLESNDPRDDSPSAVALAAPHDDSEDKNLSWLYNFKLNELPHLSPEVNRSRTETGIQVDKIIQEATSSEIEENSQIVNENSVLENIPKLPKKPPFTYTELIEYALEDKGELTVSGIYNWISDRFPFYKSNDDRWKNSVRHNLSINPHFRKGNKAPQGAGHLWIISTRDSEANLLAWEHKKQRLELFFKMEKTFLQSHDFVTEVSSASPNNGCDETSVAVANLTSLLDKSQSLSPEPNVSMEQMECSTSYQNCTVADQASSDEELKKSAGEILNGIKRTVEVQVVNPPSTFNFQESAILDCFPDYLNPVPKDQIVRESGLRSTKNQNEFGNDYFVTELDPIELGINMSSNSEADEVLFGDDFNLNYFGIVPGNNIMA